MREALEVYTLLVLIGYFSISTAVKYEVEISAPKGIIIFYSVIALINTGSIAAYTGYLIAELFL